MQFSNISGDGRLWAVHYDEDKEDILSLTFKQWNDIDWLTDFFVLNKKDLSSYFRISNINHAIFDTLNDAAELECMILDIDSDTDFDKLFRPLESRRISEMVLGKEKAKGTRTSNHASWLRLYAIKFDSNSYLITGGAIKLTRTMQEREHTLNELKKLERVRNFLINKGVSDLAGFYDMINL